MAGRHIGRRLRAQGDTPEEYGLHGLDNAALGLLALLIGFTLAMALSRYEARRAGVLDEANAIGTTVLRARLQPEPYRSELDRLLRAYVQTRLDLIRTGDLRSTIARSNALQEQLWNQTAALAAASTQPLMASLFVQTLNDTIDLQQTRITAAEQSHSDGRVRPARGGRRRRLRVHRLQRVARRGPHGARRPDQLRAAGDRDPDHLRPRQPRRAASSASARSRC